MELRSCYETLQSLVTAGTFNWQPDTGAEIKQLFEEIGICPLCIVECLITWQGDHIQMKGKTCPFFFSDEVFYIEIGIEEGDAKGLVFCLTMRPVKQEVLCTDAFPMLPDTHMTIGGGTQTDSSVLGFLKFTDWEIKGDSRLPREFRYQMTGQMFFSGERWKSYAFLLPERACFTGVLDLSGGIPEFCLSIQLADSTQLRLPSYMPALTWGESTLELRFLSHEERKDGEEVSTVLLVYTMRLPGVSTPVVFKLPLFEDNEIWALQTAFPDGLSVSSVVNFIGILFSLPDSSGLLLPDGLPVLDYFRLYGLEVDLFRGGVPLDSRVASISFLAANSSDYTPPIPLFTLKRLELYLQASWSNYIKQKMGKTVIISGYLAGLAEFKLSDKLTLKLQMDATFPEYFIHAGLYLYKKENPPYLLDDILGPLGAKTDTALRLTSLDFYADVSRRAFELDLYLKDVWKMEFHGFSIVIQEIFAIVKSSASDMKIFLSGIFALSTPGSLNSTVFELKAAYDKSWVFEGGLKKGELSVSDIVVRLFGGEVSEKPLFDIRLTELWLRFVLDEKKSFYLKAAMESAWDISLLGEKLQLRGEISFLRDTDTHVSLAGQIGLGAFLFRVEVQEVTSETPVYVFKIQYSKVFLMARYERQFIRETPHEILTVSLGKLTLGDIITYVGELMNPNGDFSLPPPWDVLHKISLSGLSLAVDFTDKKVSFLYKADLEILGLVNIEEVGISYDAKKAKEALRIVITGKFLNKEYTRGDPLSWDLQEENPPSAGGKDSSSFKLYYVGIGAHVTCGDIQKKETVMGALAELKTQIVPKGEELPDVSYSNENHWLFGAEALLGGTLHIGFVLNDPQMYGVYIEVMKSKNSTFLDSFAGLSIELLYRKITEDIGMFRVELVLPERFSHFELGYLSVTLGRMSLEVYTNGNFLLDLGFPHNRDFNRSFAISAGIYTGRGGFYFGILNGDTSRQIPKIINGTFCPVLTVGIGLSLGFGREFNFGVVKGGFLLQVVGIFEGLFAMFKPFSKTESEAVYFKVQATVGIIGRLYLSVDFKIIAISASVEIEAFAMLTMESYMPLIIAIDLALRIKAYIKILFIKIRFSFSFSYHASFSIGEKKTTPWILKNSSDTIKKARGLRKPAYMLTAREIFTMADLKFKNAKPVDIILDIRPSITVDLSEGDCLLLLPMLSITGEGESAFHKFLRVVAEWLLGRFAPGGQLFCEVLQEAEGGWEKQVTYDFLRTFFRSNLRFRIQLLPFSNEQEEGVVFPMLPELMLTLNGFTTVGEKVFSKTVDYRADTMVPASYMEEIHAYFKKLMMLKDEGVLLGSEEEKSFQEYFTEEYMTGLYGGIIDFWKGCFETMNFDASGQTLGQITLDFYGRKEDAASIIAGNREKPFADNVFLTFKHLEVKTESASLAGVLAQYPVTPDTLLAGVRDTLHLLRSQISLTVPEKQPFHIFQYPARWLAALYYVRLFEEEMTNGYEEESAAITAANSFPFGWEELQNGGRELTLPGFGQYHSLRGDTVVRLSKALMLYRGAISMPEGWSEFCQYVSSQGKLPESQIRLIGESTIGSLLRRLFPEGDPAEFGNYLCQADILNIYVPFTLPSVTIPCGGVSAAEIGSQYHIDSKQLGEALWDQKNVWQDMQLKLEKVRTLSVDTAREMLLCKEEVQSIGAGVSRFYLQGLRLPAPNGKGTAALYRLLQQELSVTASFDSLEFQLNITAGEDAWIKAEPEAGELPMGEVFAYSPSHTLTPRWIEKPVQSEFYRMTWTHYSPKESLCVHSKRKGDFMVHYMPEDFLETAGRLSEREREYTAFLPSGEGAAYTFGCLVKLRVRKRQGEVYNYWLSGADSQSRDLLYQCWQSWQGAGMLFYRAGEVQSLAPGCYQDVYEDDMVWLIRQNLSRETKSGFSLRSDGETYRNTANIGERGFIRLLWECSVVQGQFLMHYENGTQMGLPESIFDKNGMAEVYFLAYHGERTQTCAFLPGCNCIVTGELDEGQEAFYLRGKDALPVHQRQQCMFEAGIAGVSFKLGRREEPEATQTEAYREWLTGALYHIGGYALQSSDAYEDSLCSYPVLPVEDSERNFSYSLRLPLYRFAKGGKEDRYVGLGQTARLGLDIRDVYGNVACDCGQFVEIISPYHDVLYGLGDIPYLKLSYSLKKGELGLGFLLSLEWELSDAVLEVKETLRSRRESCEAAYVQYCQPDVEFSFSHSMVEQECILEKTGLIANVGKGTAFLRYYEAIETVSRAGTSLKAVREEVRAVWKEFVVNDGSLEELFCNPDSLTVPKIVPVRPGDSLDGLLNGGKLDTLRSRNALLNIHIPIMIPEREYLTKKIGEDVRTIAGRLGCPLDVLIEENAEKKDLLQTGFLFRHGEHTVTVEEGDSLLDVAGAFAGLYQDVLEAEELLLEEGNEIAFRKGAALTYSRIYTIQGDTLFRNATGLPMEQFISRNSSVSGLFMDAQTLFIEENIPLSGCGMNTPKEIAALFHVPEELLFETWQNEPLSEGYEWRIGDRVRLPVWDKSGVKPYETAPYREGGYAPTDMGDNFYLYNRHILGLVREGAEVEAAGVRLLCGKEDSITSVALRLCERSGEELDTVLNGLKVQYFLRETFDYLYRPKAWEAVLSINPGYYPGKSIWPVEMTVQVTRTAHVDDAPKDVAARTYTPPLQPDADGRYDSFVEILEQISGVHVACADQEKTKLYAVYFCKGGINSIAIGLRQERIYAALRPLSLKLISRDQVPIRSYHREKGLSEEGEAGTFTDVDIELWAQRFLEDFDFLLESQAFTSLGKSGRETAEKIISCKQRLMEGIAEQLLPIAANLPQESCAPAKTPLKNRLGASLKEGYAAGIYVIYGQSSETDQRVRLVLETEDISEKASVVKAEKIDTSGGGYVLGIWPRYAYDGRLTPTFKSRITELEYDITDGGDSYERSSWLQFYKSITEESHVKLDLGQKLSIPVPLRSYPTKPQLIGHEATASRGPKSVRELLSWDYQFTCRHRTASQDTLVYTMEFNRTEYIMMSERRDLFDALAQYISVREQLLAEVGAAGQTEAAFHAFWEMAEAIAERWGQPAMWSGVSYEVDTVAVEMQYRFDGGTLRACCPAAMWLDGMGLSYIDKDGIHNFKEESAGKMVILLLDNGCKVEPGSDITIRLTWKGLDLCRYFGVNTKIQVHRNQDLLTDAEVNPAFIYHGEVETFPKPVTAFCEWKETYVMGTVAAGEASVVSEKTVGLLFDALPLWKEKKISFQLEIRYFYQLHKKAPRIYLPIALLPNCVYEEGVKQRLAGLIASWLDSAQILSMEGGFCFALRFLYGDKVLAEFENMEVLVK